MQEEEGEEKKFRCEHTEEFNPPFSLTTSKETPPPYFPPKEKLPKNTHTPIKTNPATPPIISTDGTAPAPPKK